MAKGTKGNNLMNANTQTKRYRVRFRTSTVSIAMILLFSLLIPSMAGLPGGIGTDQADKGCTCHGVQTDEVEISFQMVGNISNILPGETYTMIISAIGGPEESGSASGGFLLNIDSGILEATDDNVSINPEGNEATHSLLGNSQRSWQIEWVAGSSNLTAFTLRVNFVDGDGASGDTDDWNMAMYYLKEDGTFTQSLVEPEARFIAPEWMQDLILVSSGLLMLLLTAIGLSSKSKGRRRDLD